MWPWSTLQWFHNHKVFRVDQSTEALKQRCGIPTNFNLEKACEAIKAKEHRAFIEVALRTGFEVHGPKSFHKR